MPRMLLALLLVASPSVLPAADPPASFSEQVDVRLVQVDLWATSKGTPVLDLTQGELRLLEDGAEMQVLYFEPPPAATAAAAVNPADSGATALNALQVAEREAGTPPPTVAVFLDDLHLGLAARSRVIAALADELGGDRFSGAQLLIVGFDGRLTVVLPRTRDLAAARRKLAEVAPPGMAAVHAETQERSALAQIQDRQRASFERSAVNLPGRASPDAEGGDGNPADTPNYSPDLLYVPCSTELLRIAEDHASEVEHEARSTLSALTSFAASLSALPGRRILLFVSDGIPSRPGGVAFDYVRTLCDGSGVRSGVQYSVDITAQGGVGALPQQLNASMLSLAGEDRQLGDEFRRVAAAANASGVTIWTYGARGLAGTDTGASTGGRMLTPEAESRERGELEDALSSFAIDSGGRPVLQSNDLPAMMTGIAADLASGYSLAYVSPRTGDGRVHQIRVDTTRPGVELRYRRSWRDSGTADELGSLVEGALAWGVDRPGLGAQAALVRGTLPGESAPRLLLRLTIPEANLALRAGKNGARSGRLRVAIALQQQGSAATSAKSKVLPIDLSADTPAGPIVRDVALPELPPGSVLAVGLRDEAGGISSVTRLVVGGTAQRPPGGGP